MSLRFEHNPPPEPRTLGTIAYGATSMPIREAYVSEIMDAGKLVFVMLADNGSPTKYTMVRITIDISAWQSIMRQVALLPSSPQKPSTPLVMH